MGKSKDEEIAGIARDVWCYLEAHPNAADTLEGIARWWLSRQRYERAKEQVQKALEQMKRDGLIVTRTSADGQIVYRQARGRCSGEAH